MSSITLTRAGVELVAHAGTDRMISALGVRDTFRTSSRERWGAHIEGAAAEFAWAQWRGREWNPAIGLKVSRALEGDVGIAQIRSRPRADSELIVYPKDRDDAPFVLVTGQIPTFVIVGYLYGHECKRAEWWRTDGRCPAYWVPQAALKRF